MSVSDRGFSEMLRPYGATWRLQRHKDRIMVIPGRYAAIQPFDGLRPQTLCAACIFPSPRCMTARLKLIGSAGVPISIRQAGDAECVFTFEASDLPRLQKALGLYRRRRDYKPMRTLAEVEA